ncbi:hypothetical protein BCV00_17325 [Vibrio breoganii]|uniref:glycosyltransferase n=1 Tax=Vibrio breoganii TaxID=553239 RepID=UPI000C849CDF|nr:glycosyltransferase [Vibrio breoganii]PMG02424.1 hypothetical protein BCV00_17325 [Vibrio breoganii]
MNISFIFNCTTNTIGGAVQNSVNFILEIHRNRLDGDWYFLLSNEVYQQVKPILECDKYSVVPSPAKSLKSRSLLKRIAGKFPGALVYTSAGPAYVKFKNPHVMGISNPYLLGPEKISLSVFRTRFALFVRKLHTAYQLYYAKKADAYIFQTESSKKRFLNGTVTRKNRAVVYNALSANFLKEIDSPSSCDSRLDNDAFKVLVPSAYFEHKCIEDLPEVFELVNSMSKKYTCYLTITDEKFEYLKLLDQRFADKNLFVNIGPFKHSEAVGLYKNCDLVLQPSVLEVFSTSYIEALSMKKALIVPDLSFTRSICENFAFYYTPRDASSCAECILTASNTILELKNSTLKGDDFHSLLSKFGTQERRVKYILSLLKNYKENRAFYV